ncbi:MAG: ABC transporter ATP-binding protein, partial [Solibacillus sp.]
LLIMVPFLIIVMYMSNKRMKKGWTVMYSEIANVNGRVEDSFSGIRVVKSFTNEEFEKERFKSQNTLFRKAKLYAYKVMAGTHSSIYIVTRLMTLTVLVVGAWLSYQGLLSYGEFVSFVLYTNVLIKPIDKISALLEMYPKGMAGFKRFCDLLDQEPSIMDRPNALAVNQLNGDIEFKNVSFNYADSKQVLKDMSFKVPAGKTVAFVGPSGSGKTTISALIPRFYDVTDGEITIDGNDIRDLTQQSLRQQIGTVQQDVFLFTGTIRENIGYGNLEASFDEILQAAEKANLLEFIEQLPDVFETEIGERGLKLSGGQKQRLAIARM